MMSRIRHRCRSLRGRLAAGLAAGLFAGCTTTPLAPSEEWTALESWLTGTAAPAVEQWRTQAGAATHVVITPVGETDGARTVSELTLEAARHLANALRADGVPADLAGARARSAPNEQACANGDTSALNLSVSTTATSASAPERIEVTVRALTDVAAARDSLVATQLVLSRRELGQVRIPRTLPAAPGAMEQPYSAADVDRMLTAFTQALRCDLLRARWRTGAPEVTWDVSRPAPWYQSFGLRLRDELARLDAVNGAPGSPRTVARLELRAEPTADLRVLRVVVRVAANAPDKEAAPSKPVIWHQSYYLAPGPTEVADPVSLTARAPPGPPVAATTPDPLPALRDPPRFSPPARDEPPAQRVRPVGPSPDQVAPARPVRPQLPDVMVGPFRAVKVGIANTCGHGTPSIQDSGASADDGPLHTGDCLVLELAAVIGQQLFVLHQTAGGSLTRVAPSACVSTPPRGAWHGAFRVPAAGPGSAVIQLTPPAGAETFLAIVMDRTVDSNTRAALAALPDTCGGTVTADALPAAQFVLDALAAEVRQGRAAMRTLTLVHTEAPAHEPADPFVQR